MRKFFIYLLCLAGLVFVSSCEQKKKAGTENPRSGINVTATVFAPYDFVREIAGDRVNLVMLQPPGTESHSFEPSPRDIITLQKSDVFICTGGESEAWVERILDSMDTSSMRILRMLDAVEALEEEIVEGMEDSGDEEAEEGAYDAHVWTSPVNALRIVEAITGTLCAADGENAARYRERAAAYRERLGELDAAFRSAAAGGRRRTLVFADRFPFRYFAQAYGLEYYAAFPGCSTETEPSAATVAFLIDKIRAEKIPAVFHIELSNERMADTISEATGAKKLLFHAAHNISKKDFEAGLSYETIMLNNLNNLKEALD